MDNLDLTWGIVYQYYIKNLIEGYQFVFDI